eukprot:CAMPEP_0181250704 /NCGR_PEP_ID=MMETSP1096-20121128/46462_1 /TAXON_ID=156174 ORGANISM="Chrysochromulina ericina, Strain CCMP281" /NCGR_SAMPLE_ID=MMETSP1096 /ASSEMBLY_ACC=CAM_ASM_000453 /LENGTH=33 /DNA_ID= /DNA_START= /DNA_END= /DNA_ORIENTATION=
MSTIPIWVCLRHQHFVAAMELCGLQVKAALGLQ